MDVFCSHAPHDHSALQLEGVYFLPFTWLTQKTKRVWCVRGVHVMTCSECVTSQQVFRYGAGVVGVFCQGCCDNVLYLYIYIFVEP